MPTPAVPALPPCICCNDSRECATCHGDGVVTDIYRTQPCAACDRSGVCQGCAIRYERSELAADDLPNYDHLPECYFHPEQFHTFLLELYRRGKADGCPVTLRRQHLGGTPDGVTLFVTPYAPDGAFQVAFRGGYWVPSYQERKGGTVGSVTKAEPMTAATKRRNPGLFQFFVDILRDFRGAP